MMVTIKNERFVRAGQVNHSAPNAPHKVAKALFRTELTNGTQTWVQWNVWSSVGLYVNRPNREGFDTRREALAYLELDFVQTPSWLPSGSKDVPLRNAP
jgi:hypothetical protein